jgi:UDP-glucose 4-epimerase
MGNLNVAVIGSNGFIGRHLVNKLQQEPGVRLFLFGKNPVSAFAEQFPYERIDLMNANFLRNAFQHIDLVYYLAFETIPVSSWEDPTSELDKNLYPFIHFLETVSSGRLKKVVFLSSAGTVYGEVSGRVDEDADKRPFSPYGISKLAMENYLNYYKHKVNLQYDIYRISNVYGENQDTSKGLGLINTFLEKIVRKEKLVVYGDGEHIRNYIYIHDVCAILAMSIYEPLDASMILNVASDDTLSINEVITKIKSLVDMEVEVNYVENRKSDNRMIDLRNERLKQRFPSFRFTPLLTGLQQTLNYIKANL